MTCDIDPVALCPFEGPDATTAPHGKSGLRAVEKKVWEEMLLSESSLFISPHRLILKTCGTTLNLLGLPRILAIAREHAGLPAVYQCFYSRKAFMFPDKQLGPHRDWGLEIEFLDRLFEYGSAYTVGKVNQRGDHWLLYMTNPDDMGSGSGTEMSSLSSLCVADAEVKARAKMRDENWAIVGRAGLYTLPLLPPTHQDYTIEILMTHLSPRARSAFFTPDTVDPCCTNGESSSPGVYALHLSDSLGIADIFPRNRTQLDAYSFTPCGYSANALVHWGDAPGALRVHDHLDEESKKLTEGEGYYTIHVTPEEGWSYASFECNVPLAARHRSNGNTDTDNADDIPDLRTLVRRVVRIFEPGKITMSLFVQSRGDGDDYDDNDEEEDEIEYAVEAAQRAFKAALTRSPKGASRGSSPFDSNTKSTVARETGAIPITIENGDSSAIPSASTSVANKIHGGRAWAPVYDRVYKRTDKINYEFGRYDLAFASFEVM